MDARSLLLDRVPGLGRFRGDIMGGLLSAGGRDSACHGLRHVRVRGARKRLLPRWRAGRPADRSVVGIACVALGDKSANVYAPRVITTFFIGILLYGLVHSDRRPEVRRPRPDPRGAVLDHAAGRRIPGALRAHAARHGDPLHPAAGDVRLPERRGAASPAGAARQPFGFDKSITFVQALKDIQHARPLSLLLAVLTIVAMLQARRWLPKVPRVAGRARGRHDPLLPPRPGGLGTDLGPTIGIAPFSLDKVLEPAAVRGARQGAGRPGAVADDRRRRARARHHRLDRRPALQQAPCAAAASRSRRRPAAGAARRLRTCSALRSAASPAG